MDISAAKKVVTDTKWTYHPGSKSLGVSPHLQALWTKALADAVQVLGVDFAKGHAYAYPTTGGVEFTFSGPTVGILESHIPNMDNLKATAQPSAFP